MNDVHSPIVIRFIPNFSFTNMLRSERKTKAIRLDLTLLVTWDLGCRGMQLKNIIHFSRTRDKKTRQVVPGMTIAATTCTNMP